jgi:membrane protease subunit HflK
LQRQRINDAFGKAARFEAILLEYRKAPLVTRQRLYYETIEMILNETREFVLSSDTGQDLLPILTLGDGNATTSQQEAAAASQGQ